VTVDGRWPNWFLVANGMQLDFFLKKTNNAEHDGGLGMAMLSLLKLILISTGLTCMRTRTSMGDEAIVVRVHDGGVEDPVHLDEPRLLVQLVLDLAPLGDLHDLLIEERSRISQSPSCSRVVAIATTLAASDAEKRDPDAYHVEDRRSFRTCRKERAHRSASRS